MDRLSSAAVANEGSSRLSAVSFSLGPQLFLEAFFNCPGRVLPVLYPAYTRVITVSEKFAEDVLMEGKGTLVGYRH